MKHLKLFFALMAMCLASFTEVAARVEGPTPAANGSTVYLPASDGVCSLYTVDGTVTFKAVASGSIPDYKDFGCAFQPANDGDLIMITVNAIGISGGTRLIMYDGDGDYTKIGTSGAGGSAPFNYFPAGWIKELTASDVGYTYTSTATNGMLSFGCTTRGTAGMTGWEITVTSLSPKDMEYVSAAAVAGLVSTHRGAKAQEIFGVDIVMDGGANPLVLNELNIDASVLSGSAQVTNMRLMRGSDVLSAPSTVGDALMATDVTLRGGHNKFIVLADILPDATGSIPSLSIANVKIDGASRTATPATATAVAISNVIQMGSTPATYTIDAAAAFYDDGGIAGNITQGFEGTLTFVPATDGQSIKVDFSKLDLFNTSSTGYNDVFKFYNGRTVDEANLITTILDEPELVKSTAADGSMTVYLKSTAGYPKSGWEAAVSQFLPGPMTMSAVNAQAVANGTVSAGDRDVQMLVVDVLTDNTSSPLSMTNIALKISDIKNVANIRAYYLGKKNSFSNTSVFAQTAVTSTNIVLAGNKELNEGHNYFAIVLDLNDEGVNGERIDVELQSVTVAGTTHAVSASASCSVDNICRLTKGSHVHTIREAWKFTHTASEFYPNKYEYEDAEYVVTFTPAIAGTVAEIEFSKFDVYYVNSAYGTKAVFEIYSGTAISNENLLWKLSDATQSEEGPGRKIRSTAADGSLTIRFNPKTTSSYYAGTGWQAIVRPFQDHAMTIANVQVNQSSTAVLPIGVANADLLDLNVITEGTLTPKNLTGISLDLKGTHDAIGKVSVYCNTTNDRATAALFGEVENPATSSIVVSGSHQLTEGNNYLWITVDIKSTVPENTVVDAAVVAIVDAAEQTAVAAGDPDGSRTVKHMIIIAAGANGEVKVATGQSIMFYDDGGPDADGADGFEATITFAPLDAGAVIKLIDKGITFVATAHLYIYEGDAVDDTKLIADIKGTSAKFEDPIISNSPDGKITIKYVGKGSYTRPNFAIEVQGYQKQAFEVKSYTVADVSPANVMAGEQDVQMLHVAMTVVGDYVPLELQQFSIEATQNAALESVTVYTTGTEAAFAPVHKFGQAQGASSITGSYTMAKDGVYNFWIAYNVKGDAAVGSQASAKLTAFTINGTQTTVYEDITANISVTAGAHGIYTIGAGGDYPTIQAAVDAISAGVDGPVVLNIKSGDYNEKVSVPHIPGASAVNTITLQSESGNRNDVKIFHNRYDNLGTGTDYQLRQYGVLTVSGCDWFTLRNVEVTTTDNTYPGVIVVKNESRHVTIEGCHLHTTTSTDAQKSIDIINMTPIDEANRNNDFITVRNNLIEGGYIGVRIGGTGYVRLPKEVGAVVEGNTFKNNGTKAIYVMDELGAKIRNNTVSIDADAETKISVGILDIQLRDEYNEPFEITGNIFNVAPKTYCPVINLRQVEATAAAPMLVANNVINIASLNASYSGIKLNGTKVKNLNIAHNTIRMTGTNGGAAFWASSKLDAGYDNINVVNNIIQNETSGYAVNLYNDDNLGKINFQNNIIYTAGETFFRAATTTTGNFDAFVTATGATGCINKKVDFLSDNVLEPANNLAGDLLTAKALSYVSTDIAGKARPATGITIGAYEYTPDMVPTMLTGYPKVLAAIDGNASIAVRTDVAATVYCIVLKATEAAPTADELKASAFKLDVAADREASIEVSGLEIGGEYIAYLLPVSLRGTDGTMSQTTAFTMAETPAPIAVPVADVYINNSTTEWSVAQGESVTLMAMVTVDERSAPYTLTWMDSKRNVLLTQTYAAADDIDPVFTISHTPTECTDYIFQVSDNAANITTDTVRAIVTGNAITATFENLYLDSESFWNAQTTDGSDNAASFVSGSYKFPAWNLYGGSYWYGYALSNETATAYTALKDQYRSAAGGGYNGSENYVVHFVSSWDEPQKIEVLNNAQGDIVSGFYVTNTAYAINSMTNGDGFAKKFEQGDWFKLTATGDNGNTAEFYLADLRSDTPADHYILDTWQWFDLSVLGQVKSISFALTSSDVGAYGMNTPSYFCLDNFGGTRNICNPVTHEFSESACSSYDWNGTVYDASGDYVQTLTAANGCDSTVTLHLTINQPVTHEFTEVAEGKYVWNGTEYTQSGNYVQSFTAVNGCDSTVTLHLTITNGSQTGLISIERENLSAYPNPTTGELWLTVPELVEGTATAEVLVYSINGQLMLRVPMRASAGSASVSIDLSGYPAGIYIVRMGRAVAKVIKQ